VDIEVPSRTDLLRLTAGEMTVEGIDGTKDVSLPAEELDIDVGRPEGEGHRSSIRSACGGAPPVHRFHPAPGEPEDRSRFDDSGRRRKQIAVLVEKVGFGVAVLNTGRSRSGDGTSYPFTATSPALRFLECGFDDRRKRPGDAAAVAASLDAVRRSPFPTGFAGAPRMLRPRGRQLRRSS
jgi:hypothetical protein